METDGKKGQKLTKEDLRILQQLSGSDAQEVSAAAKKADRKVNRIILRRLIEVLEDDSEQKAA